MIISTVEKCFHFYLMQEGERGEMGKRGRWEKHKVILHVARHDGGTWYRQFLTTYGGA